MLTLTDAGIIDHNPSHGSYMPTIVPLSDGSFIASQHVGSSLGANDCAIEILRSSDGKTWRNEGSIHGAEHPPDGFSYRGPRISVVADDRLAMTATRFETTTGISKIGTAQSDAAQLFDPDSEALQRPEMLLYYSSDQGRTWSEPRIVPVDLPPDKYTCNGAGSLTQFAPDRWMYPLETWKPEGYQGPPDQKAAAVFSADQGQTWGEFTPIADDESGRILWWDLMNALLPDGRAYTLLWSHLYGTSEDLVNHWTLSHDQGRTWSEPQPTNLRGQVCTPIPLADGRLAAIYNFRHDPHGIRVALSEDLATFDTERELVVFDAGTEATLGEPSHQNFLAEHMLIAVGKPGGIQLADGDLLVYFWCSTQDVTHTRWARLSVD